MTRQASGREGSSIDWAQSLMAATIPVPIIQPSTITARYSGGRINPTPHSPAPPVPPTERTPMSACSYIRPYAQPETEHRNAPRDAAVPRRSTANRAAERQPASLAPGEDVMFGCLVKDEECCAIRDSWRPSLPIVVLRPHEFRELASRDPSAFTRALPDRMEDTSWLPPARQ